MTHDDGMGLENLKRLPGLYRRWELAEVFKPNRNYHIEDAGTHADGTPLLAVFVDDLGINSISAQTQEPSDGHFSRIAAHDLRADAAPHSDARCRWDR